MTSVLKVENLVSTIDLFTILQGIDMEVKKGEAVAILGRNGAGKTTLLRSIMGLVNVKEGSIDLAGESLVGMPIYEISKMGVGYVPEDYGVFDELTIEENFKIAMHKEDKETLVRIEKVLELFPDLKIAYKRLAKTLSGGQRQMLSIGRALINDNKIILIDEPSKGLAPVVIENLALALKKISQETTIVLVEQNFQLAYAVTSRYYIIDEGRTVNEGLMEDLAKDRELQAIHLGI